MLILLTGKTLNPNACDPTKVAQAGAEGVKYVGDTLRGEDYVMERPRCTANVQLFFMREKKGKLPLGTCNVEQYYMGRCQLVNLPSCPASPEPPATTFLYLQHNHLFLSGLGLTKCFLI